MTFALTHGLGVPPAIVRRGMGAASSPAQIQAMIVQAAQAKGVPVNLALGIASHESGFNPDATNYNPATATRPATTDYGLFQLNTSTLQTYGISPSAALDPETNVNTGVNLLSSLLQKYNGNQQLALWAYAQGSGTVANSPNGPNSNAQSFINYVTSFDPSSILSSLGFSSGSGGTIADYSPDSSNPSFMDQVNASVAGVDFSDPVTLGVTALVGAGLFLLLREL